MTILKTFIHFILKCSTILSVEVALREFPMLAHRNTIVAASPAALPNSLRLLHVKEQFRRETKNGTKYGKFDGADGNTQHSNPAFFHITKNNLSKANVIDQRRIYLPQRNSGNNGMLLNGTQWHYLSNPGNRLNRRNFDGKFADRRIRNLRFKQSKMIENLCAFNEKDKYFAELKNSLRFWDVTFNSVNEINSVNLIHISTIRRQCDMNEAAAILCCNEIIENFTVTSAMRTNFCDSRSESMKCNKFCVNEMIYPINSKEYACMEYRKSSNKSTVLSDEKTPNLIFNKTRAIVFGRRNEAKNSQIQSWAQQMLQNLDLAFAQEQQLFSNSRELINNSVLLNQWVEFPELIQNSTNQQNRISQFLKAYQKNHNENIISNTIRFCITNYRDNPEIICTEQRHYSTCLLDDPNQCITDGSQIFTICRQIIISDRKISETNQLSCESLNHSIMFWNYLHEVSTNTGTVLFLELLRSEIIIQPFDRTLKLSCNTTLAPMMVMTMATKNNMKKLQNCGSDVKFKTEGWSSNSTEKYSLKLMAFEAFPTANDSLAESKNESINTTETNSTTQIVMLSDNLNDNNIATENGSINEPKIDVTELKNRKNIIELTNKSLTEIKNWNQLDKIITNELNANNIDDEKLNVTVELQFSMINNESEKRTSIANNSNTEVMKSKKEQQLIWKPFHMDCTVERDEFDTVRCNEWATAGYCLTNNATRFLWCRRTCLCVGPI